MIDCFRTFWFFFQLTTFNCGYFSELERERIARIRRTQKTQTEEKRLSRTIDFEESESQKSKRIGKVVIKLRNGKKLVVKKRRKQNQNNNAVKATTQKPVLVTVKSAGAAPGANAGTNLGNFCHKFTVIRKGLS